MRLTLDDFEAEGRERMDPVHNDFFAGAAGDETTNRANRTAFDPIRLRPRILRHNDERDLTVELFGRKLSLPVYLAPTGFHKLAHPEGELATARAAAAAKALMVLAMASTTLLEEVADAAREASPDGDPDLWFQIYIQPGTDLNTSLVRRCEDAGYRAFTVSVDSPVFDQRNRDHRNGFRDIPAGLRCENMVGPGDDGRSGVRNIQMDAALDWERIDWFRSITSLPVLLKGVLHPEDARIAADRGIDGVIVSNHGGRQLDGAMATMDALEDIVAAVPDDYPVLVDGGVRRGIDVIRALALGAKAVGIGRPVLWALATDGEQGVADALEIMRTEYDRALTLMGGASAADLGPGLVSRVNR